MSTPRPTTPRVNGSAGSASPAPPASPTKGCAFVERAPPKLPVVTLGVCAMDVKARSKAMREILTRLVEMENGGVEVNIFGDVVILEEGECLGFSSLSHVLVDFLFLERHSSSKADMVSNTPSLSTSMVYIMSAAYGQAS